MCFRTKITGVDKVGASHRTTQQVPGKVVPCLPLLDWVEVDGRAKRGGGGGLDALLLLLQKKKKKEERTAEESLSMSFLTCATSSLAVRFASAGQRPLLALRVSGKRDEHRWRKRRGMVDFFKFTNLRCPETLFISHENAFFPFSVFTVVQGEAKTPKIMGCCRGSFAFLH